MMGFDDIVEKDSLADYMGRLFKKKEKKQEVSAVKDVEFESVVRCMFCDESFKISDCTRVGNKEICRPCFFRLRNILRYHWDVEEESFPKVQSVKSKD